MAISPWIEQHALEGGPCTNSEFKEHTGRPEKPDGYPDWFAGNWNDSRRHADYSQVYAGFLKQQDDRANPEWLDGITIPFDVSFIQFSVFRSGCRSADCLDCCVLILVVSASFPDAMPACGVLAKMVCAPTGTLKCQAGPPWKLGWPEWAMSPVEYFLDWQNGHPWRNAMPTIVAPSPEGEMQCT